MNEKQYRKVCEACDGVLLSPNANIETTAIPWLHVVREHPFFLEQYKPLLGPPTHLNAIKKYVRHGRNVLGWVRQFFRALISEGESWKTSRPLIDSVDVLFVSHLLNNEDAGNVDDFYYGNLPELIEAYGRRVVVALIDHSSHPNTSIVECWDSNTSARVLLSPALGFKDEWSLYRRLRYESARLAKYARTLKPGLLQRVYSIASYEAMSGGARSALRISEQVGRLVATIKPKIIIVTYEGHAWERVVFSTAQERHPGIKCIGYQHAAIFKLQHAAFRCLGKTYDPKLILTSGKVSKMQIEDLMTSQKIPIEVLGSCKAKSVSEDNFFLNLTTHEQISSASDDFKNSCLVLPEGFISESLHLFDFSLTCAKLMPNVNFIWRLHPLIKFEHLISINRAFQKLPKNIELSIRPLEEDIKHSRYALYRGSTSIVKAMSSNICPIYLEKPYEMNIDPLYQIGDWRKIIKSVDQLISIINKTTDEKDAVKTPELISQYIRNFYTPLDPNCIIKLLQTS